jgi:nitrogen fixation/metabolism regulation signal transduction histidine kinase
MENGGGNILVTTKQVFAADCSFVEFQVCDNGPGFNADNMTNLFEPYVTTKAKGTGLGLAVVKKIIEEHGGMIWAENRSEGGGLVAFRLPIMASNQATMIPKSESEE